MNEIKMTVKEAIKQLDDLKRDREGFAENDEPDSVFSYDIKAIDVAIKALEDNIKLNKQNEEIQNSNIEYYNRAKDAEDRCKKIEQQNVRLKELLRATAEDAKGLFKACDKEYYKHDTNSEPENCKFCINYTQNGCDENYICKWRYADKVEEVLKDG